VLRHALQIAAAYGCQMVEGVLSHQMKQFVIDANKCVLNRPSSEARVEDGEFEENEVYAVDIVVSTGEGKTRVRSCRA
jgi:methionine aminopeptidase